jgi:DNA-binding NarL/FixJ family response regulator
MKKTTVFLADDHPILRDGLRSLLSDQPDVEVVGDAANGAEALEGILKLQPDIVLMDIAMPMFDGIEVTTKILEKSPSIKVIILSIYDTSEHIYKALRAGAVGYLLKEAAGIEVVSAVRAVIKGQRYLSQKISEKVIEDYVRNREEIIQETPLELLSSREKEILTLVAEGNTSAEIANQLFLSPKTIDTYRSRLMKKINVKDIPSLVKFAIRHKLIKLD